VASHTILQAFLALVREWKIIMDDCNKSQNKGPDQKENQGTIAGEQVPKKSRSVREVCMQELFFWSHTFAL
jgi:hypothetical protein